MEEAAFEVVSFDEEEEEAEALDAASSFDEVVDGALLSALPEADEAASFGTPETVAPACASLWLCAGAALETDEEVAGAI